MCYATNNKYGWINEKRRMNLCILVLIRWKKICKKDENIQYAINLFSGPLFGVAGGKLCRMYKMDVNMVY